MANLSFAAAVRPALLDTPDLVAFGNSVTRQPFFHRYESQTGEGVSLTGTNFTYDAAGRLTGGTVNEIQLDLGAEGAASGLRISGLSIPAQGLLDNPRSFWDQALGGSDVFDLAGLRPDRIGVGDCSIFGDGLFVEGGRSGRLPTEGARDVFLNASLAGRVAGDLAILAEAPYAGGDDTMIGVFTTARQTFIGDVGTIFAGATLAGGDDVLRIASANALSFVAGDVALVSNGTARNQVTGGDDTITGVSGVTPAQHSRAALFGDVETMVNFSEVIGGVDRIAGGDGAEFLSGDVGLDRSSQGARLVGGADTITAGGGDDLAAGELIVSYGAVSLQKGAAVITGGADTIRGGAGSDRLFGEIGTTDLAALALVSGGNDQILGEAGDDFLFGQTGNDVLNGGAGADQLSGGTGTDRASYANASAGVTANLNASGLNRGEAAGDVYASIENLEGSGHADTLVGNSGANRLIGRFGADTISGGGGNDVFAYGAAGESTSTVRDVILDFARGDRIDLSAIDTNLGAGGDQAFAFIAASGFTGLAGQLRAVRAASDTFIEADVNGDRVVDFALRLDDPFSLSAGDFVL